MKTKEEIIEDRKKRLIESRKLAGYTLAQVAKKIGATKASISRWETGETETIKVELAQKLAELYQVDQAWLLGYEDEKPQTAVFDGIRMERMKKCRLEKGLSITEVASKIGVNHSTYSRWESGTTSTMRYPDLLALSKLFDVNQEWLYGYDVPKCDKQQIIKEKREQLSQILLKIPDDDLDRVYQMIKLMLGKDDSK